MDKGPRKPNGAGETSMTRRKKHAARHSKGYERAKYTAAPCFSPACRASVRSWGMIESSAFDIRPSGTGYRISLRITSNLPGSYAISHFDLELPWKDPDFNWLTDPIEYEADPPLYRAPGKHPLEYEREMVINHCADVTRMWSRGQSISGYLLAFGGPIKHGEWIAAIVNVVDRFDRKYSSPVSLWADRGEKFLRAYAKKAPRKRLHECPDPA